MKGSLKRQKQTLWVGWVARGSLMGKGYEERGGDSQTPVLSLSCRPSPLGERFVEKDFLDFHQERLSQVLLSTADAVSRESLCPGAAFDDWPGLALLS